MDVKQLSALVTVAETGSVTRAAELLHLVQPAVTRQIRSLEDELGVPLFDRTRSGMRLTPPGQMMLDRARRVLTELQRARAEIQREPETLHGIVTVGLLESTSDLIAARLVSAVREQHPQIELRLVTGYSGHLEQWLDIGDLDLTLLYNLESTPSLHARTLAHENLWLVAPPAAGLRSDRPVPLREVAKHPLVMPAPGHSLRTLLDGACTKAKVALTITVETNSLRVQKQLVLAGHGWTILPGVGVADDITAGTLSAAPICKPEVMRTVVLALPRTARTPPAVGAVAHRLIQTMRTAVREGAWPSAQWRGDEE